MKLIDLLLVAALISLSAAVAQWSTAAGLVVFSVGCGGLWYLLDEGAA